MSGPPPSGPRDVSKMKRRCVRIKRDGVQCANAPILGGTVCEWHGGRAPQVRAAAQARLAAMVPAALDALDRATTDAGGRCDKCGRVSDRPSSVRAAIATIDRAGLAPTTRIEVEHVSNSWLQHLTDEELDQVHSLMEKALGRMPQEGQARQSEEEEEEPVH